mmetsp:Transcript_21045/g.64741  ORF Transcript_21045/g.64741 Transcript_21045/m.64741 type:complete len:86 (+) Transcript_21045:146-403(+)
MAALLPPRARLVDFNWSTRVTMASDKLASMNRTVVIVTLDVELEDGSMKELKMEMDKGKLASFVEQLTAVRDECDKARRAAAGPV